MTRLQLAALIPTIAIVAGIFAEGYLWRKLIRSIDRLIARLDGKLLAHRRKGLVT